MATRVVIGEIVNHSNKLLTTRRPYRVVAYKCLKQFKALLQPY